jgi:ABC-2 type transport system permease protein
VLPLTHGIEAARALVSGAAWSNVRGLVVDEAVIGLGYLLIGLAMLKWFEVESRRSASLDRA